MVYVHMYVQSNLILKIDKGTRCYVYNTLKDVERVYDISILLLCIVQRFYLLTGAIIEIVLNIRTS